MADDDLLARISALVAEEHELGGSGEATAARREQLEAQLDQCWDLLRQRQAKREFGADPAEAHARPIDEVEHYQQ
jgi:DNA-binding transcriptional regulator PaaX